MKAINVVLSVGMAFAMTNLASVAQAQEAPAVAQAEEAVEDGNYYTVSMYQWPFDNMDDIFEALEEDNDLLEQNEFLLSHKVLSHAWAGDFSVMIVNEYASFDDIAKWQKRGTELYEAKYPDKEAREARDKMFGDLQGSGMHIDSIVQGNPKLTK
jgi:hypothetical protein